MSPVAFHIHFLQCELQRRKRLNPQYSLRSFARQLGLSPGCLSELVQGKRKLTAQIVEKLAVKIDMTPEERSRFISSALNSNVENLKLKNFKAIDEVHHLIADWYYSAIIEMVDTDDFQSDPNWMAEQIGIEVPLVRMAWQRLEDLGLVKQDGKGRYKKVAPALFTVKRQSTSASLIEKQIQFRKKAIESLQKDNLDERVMISATIPIDPKKIAAARTKINKFCQNLSSELTSGKRQQVYVLEVSLFPVQRRNKK